jgi:hypothetical protein
MAMLGNAGRGIVGGLMIALGFGIGAAQAQETTEQRLMRLEGEVGRLSRAANTDIADSASEGNRLSWHGYGELHYNNPKTGAKVPNGSDPAAMDLHRMVWGLSYAFTDRISAHTEVDFEHAAQEMELEFAYLDFAITPAFNFRAGSLLMPVGPLNEFHEPPLFYSVERPYVQAYIIPTTWQEGGAGVFGSLGGLKYRVYLVSGLDAAQFTPDQGLRGGRGKVNNAPSEDLAVVGRLEYVGLPGVDLGLSAYQGGANPNRNAALTDANVGIWEADARLRFGGLDLRGVVATVAVDAADQISAVTMKTIGDQMLGWYVEAGYDVLRLLGRDQSLVPFVRYEAFDTQRSVPAGLTADPTNDRTVTTAGVAYYPIPDVAIKGDWEGWKDGTGDRGGRVNLGVGYQF